MVYGHCNLGRADIEEATIITTGAADDDGANEEEVKKKRPADKLLRIESAWDKLKTKSRDSQNEECPLTT